MTEKIYIGVILISYVFVSMSLIISGAYPIETVLVTLFVTFLGYLLAYKIYKTMCRDTYEKNRLVFVINHKRFNYFMFIYLIIMIIYSIKTGDGKAEGANLHSSSIFASLWVPDAVFGFYFFSCREDYKKFTWINTGLYLLYKILLGWTGAILGLLLYELSFRLKEKRVDLLKILLGAIVTFVAGGIAYSFASPLKYAIRYGIPYSSANRLPIIEGVTKLAGRLNRLETTLFVNENISEIVNRYRMQNISLLEFKSAFRPIIPSFIFKNKIFSNIGSCIYNVKSGGYNGINITDNCSILYYFRLLFKCDFASFLLCILLTVICFYLFKYLSNMIQTKPGQFNFMFFLYFIDLWSCCGSLENTIMASYIKFVFFIPLLWVLGVGRLRIKRVFL